MAHTPSLPLLAASLLAATACMESPTDVALRLDETAGAHRIGVYTQNLYVGADVDAVLAALLTPDATDDLPALLTAIETLEKTSFPVRAAAIADEIERERPHAVAFQEVSEIHIDLSALGGPTVDLSFLPIVEAKLAERGLPYTVAATVRNLDVTLLGGAIRLVDYDAILVNPDLATLDFTEARNFTYNFGPVVPGVELKRGFAAAWATIDGVQHVFMSTHLEPDFAGYDLSELRAAQASEIAAVLAGSTPAFVMGDLNDRPGSLMYQVFQAAEFDDVWRALRPGADGFTAGEGYTDERRADLSNAHNGFTQRIDYIWARNVGHPTAGLQGRVTRFGTEPSDKVEGPYFKIWPSDHAGLVAELLTPAAVGLR